MYRKMVTEATAMGEVMEAMATGEARRVMMEQEPEPVSRLYIAVKTPSFCEEITDRLRAPHPRSLDAVSFLFGSRPIGCVPRILGPSTPSRSYYGRDG